MARRRTVMNDIADPKTNTKPQEAFGIMLLIGISLFVYMWFNESWLFAPDNTLQDIVTDEKTGVDEDLPNIVGDTPTPHPTRDFGPTIPSNAEAVPTSIYPLSLEKCNEMYAAGHWNDGIQARCDRVYEARVEEDELFMKAAVAATVNAMSYATAVTEATSNPVRVPPCNGCRILAHDGRVIVTPVPQMVQPPQVIHIPPSGYQRAQVARPRVRHAVRGIKSGWERAIDATCGTFFSIDPRGYAGAGSLYGDPTRGCHR